MVFRRLDKYDLTALEMAFALNLCRYNILTQKTSESLSKFSEKPAHVDKNSTFWSIFVIHTGESAATTIFDAIMEWNSNNKQRGLK